LFVTSDQFGPELPPLSLPFLVGHATTMQRSLRARQRCSPDAYLQVMPWPKLQNMTDRQLTAIWTYLSTVPCNAHNDQLGNEFPWLKNVCSSNQ
jgi:hypothetical protein